ncbi:shikimate dehydrogenase [Lichenicola cladoniae]|uniref:Shikimate dehydrogenase n=1 Tax=Lichenicola cladoniae TaxID=1484109 RepID=A0A6M8HL14_9PROT|nr:shikimate dehydrogenase [Lichenicola cladoniae]NPD66740.1 shikimate dehydrogenase [Acetobacteraceae bacterium]QKE88685.1 shikimate dehydrogenase [Lichenicola cladoniae]
MTGFGAATLPTLYFIGVTTGQSSIMTIFPRWAEALGLMPCAIRGIDLPLHAEPEAYREVVSFIKNDPLSVGALVTAHKIDLLHVAADLFDELDDHASALHEVSCLSKREGRLIGHAKDPISARLALDAVVPKGHWGRRGAAGGDAFLIGAGGAATAITWNLMHPPAGEMSPGRIVVSDVSEARLDGLRRFHAGLGSKVRVDYVLSGSTADNDGILRSLSDRSLVVNATGLGKDRPGSPLGQQARFPAGGIVWELNYRGDLLFLDRAEQQAAEFGLTIFDGWNYFLHGWTQVIAEVFAIEIPTSGPKFEALSALAGGAPRQAGIGA